MRDLKTISVLVLLAINFIPIMVTPLTNLDEVTAQGPGCSNSNAWGWHNSYQSGVIGITDHLILQNGKRLQGVQEEQVN